MYICIGNLEKRTYNPKGIVSARKPICTLFIFIPESFILVGMSRKGFKFGPLPGTFDFLKVMRLNCANVNYTAAFGTSDFFYGK